MKYVGLTFSDEKYLKTRERYVAEMDSKDIFSKIFSYGPEDLDAQFLEKHNEFILQNPRGYGYWIWKPHIILKVLNQLEEGDILVYGDAGCEMKGSRVECLQLFDSVKRIKGTKILANGTYRSYQFIKTDLYFRIRWYAIIYGFNFMAAAGRLIIEKNAQTVKLVTEWLYLCTKNYRNIDDSPSFLPKAPRFIEHRHDQSIFSLLFRVYKCELGEFGDVWPASRLKY